MKPNLDKLFEEGWEDIYNGHCVLLEKDDEIIIYDSIKDKIIDKYYKKS